MQAKGLLQVSDEAGVKAFIREVMAANPKQLEEFRGGKVKLLGYFQGMAMKASQGRVNPGMLNKLLGPMLEGKVE